MLRLIIALALLLMFPKTALAQPAPPRVLLLDGAALQAARAGEYTPDELIALTRRADQALTRGPFTVTHKDVVPPSGDVHDYVSLSIYWWPDPSSLTGLPYIQRDGVRNPEADKSAGYDAASLNTLTDDVEVLSLAYYLTGDVRYAVHAVDDLRAWFLDPTTRMNPNFRFAQIIPGREAIRGTGIIESRRLTRVVDSVALLQECACWTPTDDPALREWFAQFATWLRTSPNGQMEARTSNNHAVWYDVQVVDFALFAGDLDAVRQVASSASRRINAQIAADGSMPRELERTRSLHYSNFNLQAFTELATLVSLVDVDLWNETTADGASLRTALDFLLPYVTDPHSWPHDEITEVDGFKETGQTLRRAAAAYPDGPYIETLEAAASHAISAWDRLRLRLGYWPD